MPTSILLLKKISVLVWTCLLVFLFTFSVYAYTAARTNPGYADSDEMITSAYTLGAAHPPGYPLMIVLTRLFTLLPIAGTFAFRANLFAGFLQALTLALLTWLGYRLLTSLSPAASLPFKKNRATVEKTALNAEVDWTVLILALTASLSLGFSALFWLYASVLEVFALNNLLIIAGLLAAWEWRQALVPTPRKAWWWFVGTSFIAGVGLSHVQSYLFLLPGFLVVLVVTLLEKRQWHAYFPKQLGVLIGGIAFGIILPSSLLFWLNSHQADYSWSFDQTLKGWWNMLLRQDYQGYIPDKGVTAAAYNVKINIPGYFQTLPKYLEFLNGHFAYIGLGFGLVGLGYLLWQRRKLFWLLAPFYLVGGLWFSLYLGLPVNTADNLEYRSFVGVTHRQYLQGEVLWSLAVLFGLYAIVWYLRKSVKPEKYITGMMGMVGIGLVGWMFSQNFAVGNQRDNRFAWEYSRALLDQVEPGGVLLCSADLPCFSLFYQQTVEKYRPEVTVLSQNNHLSWYKVKREAQWRGYDYDENPFFFAELISWNVAHRPTYLTDANSFYISYVGLEGNPFFLVPKGLLYQVVTQIPKTVGSYEYQATRYLLDLPKPKQNYWLNGTQDYLASIHNMHGLIYSHLGLKESARVNYDLALKLNPNYEKPKILRDSLVGFAGNPAYQPGSVSSSSAQLVQAARQKQAEAQQNQQNQSLLQEVYHELQKATFVEPKASLPRLELAKIYKYGGYEKEARQEYENVLKYNPDNEEAKQELAKLEN